MQPMPLWVSIVVTLSLVALLGYNIVVFGVEGYATTMVLGTLLGGYGGLQEYLKNKKNGGDPS